MNDKPEKCGTCQHKLSEFWQCSYLQCPNRRPLTADAPAHTEDGPVPALINDNH